VRFAIDQRAGVLEEGIGVQHLVVRVYPDGQRHLIAKYVDADEARECLAVLSKSIEGGAYEEKPVQVDH